MRIESERLVLRPHESGDVERLHAQWKDPEVWTFIGGGRPGGLTLAEVAAAIARQEAALAERGWSGLIVERREDELVLGECGLYPWRAEVELGYKLGGDHWGRGYATEAAAAAQAWAVELGITELVAVVQSANVASGRVAGKLGFTVRETLELDYGEVAVRPTSVWAWSSTGS